MRIDILPTEILLQIFKYLKILDLCRLKQTCKRFNQIITNWGDLFIKSKRLLVTNQIHNMILNRTTQILPPFERCRISRNWIHGVYNEKSVLYDRERYMPWMELTKNLLWLSRERHIRAYKRNSDGNYMSKIRYTLKGITKGEVCRFKLKNDLLISGQRDGSMWLWSSLHEKYIFNLESCHKSDINSVDLTNDIVVSGSADEYVKIWRQPLENVENLKNRVESLHLSDRIWSVALSDGARSLLAIGTAGIEHLSTLTIFDITRKQSVAKYESYSSSQGILDMKWENSHVLWSCGYNGYLCKWDLRSGCVVQTFRDPCASSLYCFEHDGSHTILSGTSNNGRVVLWDTRKKNYVQMYFMRTCKRREWSSPVYSLSFEAKFLFAVTDKFLNILDFSVSHGKIRDYSNLSFV